MLAVLNNIHRKGSFISLYNFAFQRFCCFSWLIFPYIRDGKDLKIAQIKLRANGSMQQLDGCKPSDFYDIYISH